jgi:hypothetical protein
VEVEVIGDTLGLKVGLAVVGLAVVGLDVVGFDVVGFAVVGFDVVGFDDVVVEVRLPSTLTRNRLGEEPPVESVK